MAKEHRRADVVYFDEPVLTKQEFIGECDINNIVERAIRTGGIVEHVAARVARYGDVSSIPDYQSALDQINRAQGMFMDLPWKVRERFANDPGKFIAFCQDPANHDEAVRLGLIQTPAKAGSVGSSPATAGKGDDSAEIAEQLEAESGASHSKPKAKK